VPGVRGAPGEARDLGVPVAQAAEVLVDHPVGEPEAQAD